MTSRRGFAALIFLELLVVSLAGCSSATNDLEGSSAAPAVADATVPPVTADTATAPSPSGSSAESPSSTPSDNASPATTDSDSNSGSGLGSGLPSVTTTKDSPPQDSGSTSGSSNDDAEPSKGDDQPVPSQSVSGRWKPPAQVTWQWQLTGSLDLGVKAQVYDVDLFDTSAAQVKQLHSQGRKVICYMSAGSYEEWRPDSGSFPESVQGNTLSGWPDERWLDVRQMDVLLPIMAARMDLCAKKGFDGVEPDNVDGYQNKNGFGLTAKDQETYNRALAKLAHDRGLAIGLKNDLDQVALLQPYFDFAVNEQCAEYDECSVLSPFIKAGKPVLHVEYDLPISSFCPTTTKLGFSSMRKSLDLDASRTPCPN